MTRYLKQARLLAGALALVVGLTLVAPPAFAAGPIAAAATARVATAPAEALAQAAQTVPATAPIDTAHKRFFKTTKGAIALVLMGGTVGYAVHSFSNGRVKSPAK